MRSATGDGSTAIPGSNAKRWQLPDHSSFDYNSPGATFQVTLDGDEPGRDDVDDAVSDDQAMSGRTKRDDRGQALVELALALPVFLMMLLGIFSLGLGVYTWNGLSQAAREIARTTSVHPAVVLGASTETRRTVATQLGLVPGMADPPPANFVCVDISGAPRSPQSLHVRRLRPGDRHGQSIQPVALLGLGGPITLTSTSSIQVP